MHRGSRSRTTQMLTISSERKGNERDRAATLYATADSERSGMHVRIAVFLGAVRD